MAKCLNCGKDVKAHAVGAENLCLECYATMLDADTSEFSVHRGAEVSDVMKEVPWFINVSVFLVVLILFTMYYTKVNFLPTATVHHKSTSFINVKVKISEVTAVLSEYETLQLEYVNKNSSLGTDDQIGWSIPKSKYFTYSSPNPGEAIAIPNMQIGQLTPNDTIKTVISSKSSVKRSFNGNQSVMHVYFQNWLNTTNVDTSKM
jgi:hypothetical protein